MVLLSVNCTIPTFSKSKAVRGKYCIVLLGEGNEFQLSTKDTLISRRVMCLVGSYIEAATCCYKTEIFSYFKCSTDLAR